MEPGTTTRLVDRRAYIVEDDALLRSTMRRLLTAAGIYTDEFGTAEALLDGYGGRPLGCILLDVRLPGMSGLDLLPILRKRAPPNPVVVVSGNADIRLAVAAVRAGAIEVVEKPFRKQRLFEAVEQAFHLIASLEQAPAAGIEALTPREREVLFAFASGDPSKAVAARLGLSQRTVEMYRTTIARKLGVRNMTQAVLKAKDSGYLP